MVSARAAAYCQEVKPKKISGEKPLKAAGAARAAAEASEPSHVSQSLSHGHEVRHWLAGEAQWRAERKLARCQGFYKRT
jgi:hypothetical protein